MILDMLQESSLFDAQETSEENLLENVEEIALKENEDPVSACYRITMENEQNWFNIMNTIAFSELAYMDAHDGSVEGMYEAVDLKKIKNTIVTWIQTQWAKLKAIFMKAIANLSEMIHKDKASVKAYEEKIKKNPGLGSKVVTVKNGVGLAGGNLTVIEDLASEIGSAAMQQYGKLFDFTAFENDSACKEIVDTWKGSSMKFDSALSKKDVKAAVSVTQTSIKVADAYQVVKAGKQVDSVKKAFKYQETEFNRLLKNFKSLRDSYDKKNNKNAAKNAADITALKSKACKTVISELNKAAKVCIQVANRHYSMHRAVLRKAVGEASTDTSKTTPRNESADLICDLI